MKVYVSDRRWQRAALLLKSSAFCNGRNETNHSDVVLLKYCLWTTPENREAVENIVMNAIKECGFDSGIDLADLDRKKDKLDKEINKELYHVKDVYDTVSLGNRKKYFKVKAEFTSNWYNNITQLIYIDYSEFKNTNKFYPLDENGNELRSITCTFDNQGSCIIKYNNHNYNDCKFTPKPLFYKGDKKEDINERLIKSLSASVKRNSPGIIFYFKTSRR